MKKSLNFLFIILILFFSLLIINNFKQDKLIGNAMFDFFQNIFNDKDTTQIVKTTHENIMPQYSTGEDFVDITDNKDKPQFVPAPIKMSPETINYDDVLVIVNSNSQVSLQVGAYFVNARNIPPQNVVYINAPELEEISLLEFTNLRIQVEDYIISHNLINSINYIVTTKGVPLKVRPTGDSCFSLDSACASVDSELMLILGAYSVYIGQAGRITSPYYYWSTSFSHTTYGIYLVTRLDGYNFEQIRAMIDKSSINPIPIQRSAKFVFDQDPDWNDIIPSLNDYMVSASNILRDRGYTNRLLDTSSVYQTYQNDVIGYISWGSNDHYAHLYTNYAIPHNTWVPGAIAETYVSTSGRSFTLPPSYGQSLIADLIAEGVTGVKGYVYEPFSSSMAIAYVLFDRYTLGYNLAESFYMSSRYLSWMDIVIGDPKTTISDEILPIELAYFRGSQLINTNTVRLEWGTISEINNYGFYVQTHAGPITGNYTTFSDIPRSFTPGHGTTNIPQHYSFEYTPQQTGIYSYRLKQIDLDGTVNYIHPIQINFNYNNKIKAVSTS